MSEHDEAGSAAAPPPPLLFLPPHPAATRANTATTAIKLAVTPLFTLPPPIVISALRAARDLESPVPRGKYPGSCRRFQLAWPVGGTRRSRARRGWATASNRLSASRTPRTPRVPASRRRRAGAARAAARRGRARIAAQSARRLRR